MTVLRVAVALVGIVVVGSLVGFGQLTGLVVLLVGLVGVLFVALGGSTPGRKGSSRRARGLPQLGRYSDPDVGIFRAIIVASAAWVVASVVLTGDASGSRTVFLGFLGVLAALVSVGGGLIALGGTIAAIASAAGLGHCPNKLPTAAVIALIGVAVIACLGFGLARSGWLPLGRVLDRRRGRGAVAIMMFGCVDVGLFVAAPNGLDVWPEAPTFSMLLVGGLVLFLATVAAFAPALILGLLSIGVVIGQVALMVEDLPSGSAPDSCPSASTALASIAVFSLTGSGLPL